jgi:hypothetical protein
MEIDVESSVTVVRATVRQENSFCRVCLTGSSPLGSAHQKEVGDLTLLYWSPCPRPLAAGINKKVLTHNDIWGS